MFLLWLISPLYMNAIKTVKADEIKYMQYITT